MALKHVFIAFSFTVSLGVRSIDAAETPAITSGISALTQENVINAPSGTEVAENDLTIGKSVSENIVFKTGTDYQQRQNAEAIQKLGTLKNIPSGPNQMTEVANILREIVASDVSQEIKGDIKRMAVLELATIAEKNGQMEQAQQFLAEYVERFPNDLIIPEVFLRQAYVFRKMGAYEMAISKLYLVMTASLRLETKNLTYYKRVVLTAQSEMAETYDQQRRYQDAADIYLRLLKSENEELNKVVVKAKLVRALAKAKDYEKVIEHANEFLNEYATSDYQAEIRYLLASAYKNTDQNQEALTQLLLLLEAVDVAPPSVAANWKRWKMLAGNEIGNQLFLEGGTSYQSAVQVYKGLVVLDESPAWRMPLHYQIGLCFEHLLQPTEAIKAYEEILKLSENQSTPLEQHLQMIVDMARFRHEILTWKQSVDRIARAAADVSVANKTN